jgi:hypothetical protein
MGRSSVEATKACLIRAVRAALAALPDLLDALLPLPAGLTVFLAVFVFVVAELRGCPEELEELLVD